MDWARRAAELSHARRLHVGAVIVKDDTVISYGYNGMPAGWDNNCEDEVVVAVVDGVPQREIKELKTKPEVLHAESNAIAKLARSHNSGVGADIFVTHAPCLDCAKLIYQSGISRVWFGNWYRDDSGIDFLQKSGIKVNKI
jgi:dCMP deaminase